MNGQFIKRIAAAACAASLLVSNPGWLAAAVVLEGVEVGPDEITVHLSDKVKFNAFTTTEPPRLVLELLDTEHVASNEYTPGQGTYLKRVRSGQYQREPDLISRVVLYLSDLVSYRASWDDSRLKISLVAADLPRKAAEVAAAVAVPAAAPAAAAAVDAATLDGVSVEDDGITISLSRKVKINAFTTEDPARLVVELFGTRHETTSDYIQGKGDLIRRVRSGQFQPEPDLTSRVVLYLNRLATYSVRWEGSKLRVTLQSIGSAEPEAPVEAVIKPRSTVKVPAPVPVPAPIPAPVVMAETPAPAPVVAEAMTPASAPAKAAQPRAAKLPAKMTTTTSAELERIAMAKDYDRVDDPVTSEEARKVVPKASMSEAKTQRDILSTLPTDPVTLDFDDMDVRDILKLLATKAKVNVVYGSEVTGAVTIHLKDVPFNEAFMTTLSMKGLIPVQVGENILRVVTPATLATQRAAGINQTKIIKLRYAQGADILPSITGIRAAEGRVGAVVHDKTTNSLVVTDSLEGITSLERVLSELDVRPQQVLIEVKIVEVTLSKDMHFGIQWDYFARDGGKILGQQGTNTIGSIQTPGVQTNPKPFDQNALEADQTTGLTGSAGRGTGITLPASKVFGAFTLGRVTNNYFLNATLTAAASEGKAKVLSDPKVTTLNGQLASINITTQIPYVTSSVSSNGVATEAVAYTTTGIQLSVTPTINADGRVHLDVNPTVSQPSATAASAGTTGAIGIDARTAMTKVLVRDGETIVIGGLITDQVNDTIAKIPLLGDRKSVV